MFYYKDLNDFLIKSSKELKSDKLTELTKEEYDAIEAERAAAAALEEQEAE